MNPLPTVSVVVAARPEDGGPQACLEALGAQRDDAAEVVVVVSAGAAGAPSEFPWAAWLDGPPDAPVPRLWGQGLARAQGAVVAFTTTQFRPSADWLDALRRAHARLDAAGIGGPIDAPPTGRAFDWAVFFLRYSAYLGHRHETYVPDLAGDNASYKRSALSAVGADRGGEFWEQEAHRKLLGSGRTLVFVPGMRVQQVGSPPALGFLRLRVRHGRRFGWERGRRHRTAWRVAALLASPLVPALLLGKVVGRVLRTRRHLGPLVRALPALAACTAAWGAGEALGYLDALGRRDAA